MAQIPEIGLLLQNLRRGFDQRSWHGPNLMGSIRGLTPKEAAWRPQPERHNAWEYIVHAAYWKYRVVRLLDSDAAESFSYRGSDFFERPVELTSAAFKQDVQVLRDWHERLLSSIESFDPRALPEVPGRSEFSHLDLILGAAAHDIYHAGQIRLLRRMWGGEAR